MKKKLLKKNKLNFSSLKKDFFNTDFYIILVEPSGSENIGMISRIMKNFGFKNLVIFNPKCQIDSNTRKYSVHARKDVLANAKIINLDFDLTKEQKIIELEKYLESENFNFVIGTSAKESLFRNVRRIFIYLDELDLNLIKTSENCKIAILFGREKEGLFNEELQICDFLIKIPTCDEYPSINLANAVSIVLYTLFRKLRNLSKGTHVLSNKKQREILFFKINQILKELNLNPEANYKIDRSFKNILGRSFSTSKEIDLLIAFFNKIISLIELYKNKNS